MRRSHSLSSLAAGGLLMIGAAITSPAEQPASLPFFKGVTVSCQTWGIEWQTPEMEATLDELKSLGVNSIAIHPYAQIREDGHVDSGRRSGASTSHITTPLRWARERGMSAMLIPHIAYWGTKFPWRGEINFATPEEWNTLLRRLRDVDRANGDARGGRARRGLLRRARIHLRAEVRGALAQDHRRGAGGLSRKSHLRRELE